MPPIPTVPFFGQRLANCATADFIEWMIAETRERKSPRAVAYLNAATTNLCLDSPDFTDLLKRFDCLYADGMGVVWGTKRMGHPIPERISAADFIEPFLRRCATEKLKIGLIGGASGEADRFAAHFEKNIAGLNFVFKHHGFFTIGDEPALLAGLEKSDPDLVLLAMGSPRQERHAMDWSARGKPRIWWCVGGLFVYYAGVRSRAPVWLRKMGLEWLFRLALEPRRLWRRYLLGNPKFVWRVMAQAWFGSEKDRG